MASSNRDADPDDLPDADVDARWTDIVARLGDVEQSGRDLGRPEETDRRTGSEAGTDPEPADDDAPSTPVARAAGPRDWPASPEVEALEETESHFVPPDPGPITHRDPLLTLAWTVVVAVPVLTVLSVVLRAMLAQLVVPGWLGPAAGGAFVAAVAVLVWRMPARRDPEDDGPGAVV
ncbi:hypothetical protein [Isoptericola sediminis]|uniref:Uncharacterized protein n=1 Tax=Isoptericola sediminis TaxID=2733572 RepID=A0A849K7Y1_9MICO|nr:hypothetical protein [Isoptericola sediminis]NNU28560.1 hypothetical protein [Isoptericola sediminis]